jgi:adenine deaminase
LNTATHFSLDGHIGAIAPGRFADILIIPDIRNVFPETVISNGTIIAQNGNRLIEPRSHVFSSSSRHSIRLEEPVKKEDFTVKTDKPTAHQAVRIIELVTDLVTREQQVDLPVSNGKINLDIDNDIVKIAAIDRAINPGDMFIGFIRGFGLSSGAIAFSASWDSADLIVIGADEADMAMAVNRVYDIQGGAVVCEKETIIAELPMPIFGVMSDLPIDKIVERTRTINTVLSKMGVPHRDPLLTLGTLTTPAIPFFRICEEGYVRLKDGVTVGLIP